MEVQITLEPQDKLKTGIHIYSINQYQQILDLIWDLFQTITKNHSLYSKDMKKYLTRNI